MKTNFIILTGSAVLCLTACAGSGFIPDSQAPRPYIAAHDIVDGQCRDVNLKANASNHFAHDDAHVVKCPQEAGGVEDAGGVQATKTQ